MSQPSALRRAPRHSLLGGFVMEPTVAGAWASRLRGKTLDPFSNFDTIRLAIHDKVRQHQVKFDLVGEVWAEAKYIVITRSGRFFGYKDMDPSDIPNFSEGDKEAKIREFLYAEGVSCVELGF